MQAQAQALLADETGNYSAVLSGTLDRPVLTGPMRSEFTTRRMQLLVDESRRTAALDGAHASPQPVALDRVVTEQANGSLANGRRLLGQGAQTLIFAVTLMLATLLLSTLVEEKTNKIIEILAASVPLESVFFGKLIAMLGISLVGLGLWTGVIGTGLLFFFQLFSNWITLPDVSPAVGWPLFIGLLLIYYTMNFLLLGGLFLGIGGQASSIREVQTISMPVVLLQLMVLMIAMNAVTRHRRADVLGRLYLPLQLAPGDDRAGSQIGGALAPPRRTGLAGLLGAGDRAPLVAPVPPHCAQVRERWRLLQAEQLAEAGRQLGRRRALLLP